MWLRVRLTGQAQKALHRLHEASRVTYETTRTALKPRFVPDSRQVRYYAELRQLLKVRARALYSAPHPHITELRSLFGFLRIARNPLLQKLANSST